MALTGPLISALTGPLTTSITGVSATTRLFATFDGTDDFISIPAVTASGDFDIEFQWSTTSTISQIIVGNSANTTDFIAVLANGTVRGAINGTNINSAGGVGNTGTLNTGSFVRVGSAIELFVNGSSVATGTEAASFSYDRIGRYSAGLYFNGVIANVDFTSGWTGTATNPSYPLDDAANTAVNSANPGTGDGTYNNFQPGFEDRELFTLEPNGDWDAANIWDDTPTIGSDWTDNGGGSYSYIGDGSSNTLSDVPPLVVGQVYKAAFSVDEITNSMEVLSSSSFGVYTTTGAQDLIGVAGATSIAWDRGATDVSTTTMNGITVRRTLEAP